MAPKLTNEELLAQFDDLGDDEQPSTAAATSARPASKAAPSKASKPARAPPAADDDDDDEDDPLAGLEDLAKAAAQRPSRPNTPKLSSSSTTTSRTRSPKRGIVTPSSTGSARTSEDKPHAPTVTRKSGDATRPLHYSSQPEEQKQQQGGGWWGGIFATASAAVKQAEAAVKEIQKNEEAQKWAERVKGNVGALRGIGGELQSRAMPTFTTLLHTLAPPISQHERLQIHITHDIVGYPSLDPMIYETFSRVMAQVEGGDLLVIQKGSESSQRRPSDAGYRGSGSSGWNDGPWWRINEKRDISTVKGLVEGTKLVRVSAESYANEFYASRGGVEEAAKQATQIISESNPVRSSDIFLAIQAISHPAPEDLFIGAPEEKKEGGVAEPDETDDVVTFAIYLHDPIHSISFRTITQSFPEKWAQWLDASNEDGAQLPAEIIEIIETGGVDPREWVAEWVQEIISLGVGVVAQRYVARRMGVGEGGIGRGKARQHVVEDGGGEAARAI